MLAIQTKVRIPKKALSKVHRNFMKKLPEIKFKCSPLICSEAGSGVGADSVAAGWLFSGVLGTTPDRVTELFKLFSVWARALLA